MYLPDHFKPESTEAMHRAIAAAPLAALVSQTAAGLVASHVPLLLEPGPAPYGTLRGHLARANSQWREHAAQTDALAIFLGPQGYVSPAWYATKAEHGKVVPTWNYVAVHASGPLRFITGGEELKSLVDSLTRTHEGRRAKPWAMSDAPADYIEGMLRGIVGFELTITKLEGKWKLSQNRSAADRAGVVHGLRDEGGDKDLAGLMSAALKSPETE